MRWVNDPHRITVPGGGGSLDVVMARQDRPFRELSIWVRPSTPRVAGDGLPVFLRDYSGQIFFGPTAQAGPVSKLDDESWMLYDPGDTQRLWPANDPTTNLHRNTRARVKGFDITAQFINNSLGASAPITVTGVLISGADPVTAVGVGTLAFVAIGTLLSWQAPGAGAPGAAQNVGAGGVFTLAGGDGSTIDVFVTAGSLPAGDESDPITVFADDLVLDVEFDAMTIENG